MQRRQKVHCLERLNGARLAPMPDDDDLDPAARADEVRGQPAGDAHHDGPEHRRPETGDRKVVEHPRHQPERGRVDDQQEQPERQHGDGQRQDHEQRPHHGVDDPELDPLLGSLARKEILGVQADPTSPEHGQYGFLQDLVRHVSYETLSKKERRTRHLAAAAYISDAFASEDEIAEVLASHYLDAYTALPDAEDAAEVKAKACAALVRAGDRAESLGASGEALRYLKQAAELSLDAPERAVLLDRAGWLGVHAADYPTSERLLAESIALYTADGDTRSAARVSGRLAWVEGWQRKYDVAIPRAETAFADLEKYDPGEEMAGVAATLAGAYSFVGESEKALEKAEFAIELAEAVGSPEILVRSFAAKALITGQGRRPEETIALRKHQLALAREHDIPELESNALFNLSNESFKRDRFVEALTYLSDALAITRRRGSRSGHR